MERQEPMSIETATIRIRSIMQDTSVLGANGPELPKMIHILEQLENQILSPEKAVEEAIGIMNRKYDYR